MSIPDDSKPPPHDSVKFPLYVRLFAVLFVLSQPLGTVAFFILCGIGCFLGVRRGGVDPWVVGLFAAGLACPLLGAGFRAWFRNWGRRNYPEDSRDPQP